MRFCRARNVSSDYDHGRCAGLACAEKTIAASAKQVPELKRLAAADDARDHTGPTAQHRVLAARLNHNEFEQARQGIVERTFPQGTYICHRGERLDAWAGVASGVIELSGITVLDLARLSRHGA
jgi:hypothetical protein